MIDLDYERAFDAWPPPPTPSESDAIDAATALAMLLTALEHPGPLALDVLHSVSPRAASWVERGLVWVDAKRTHLAWLASFGRPR